MKDMFVSFGVLIMFVVIIYTQAVSYEYDLRMDELQIVINNHVLEARSEGYFTTNNIDKLLNQIAIVANCNLNDITYNLTTTKKLKTRTFDANQMITYDINIPLRRFPAIPKINKKFEGAIASEAVN